MFPVCLENFSSSLSEIVMELTINYEQNCKVDLGLPIKAITNAICKYIATNDNIKYKADQ